MKETIETLTKELIKEKIYTIRGEKVMLDYDLAKIYGYTTKRFNEQVKNNDTKFVGFMFQLTKEEWLQILKSKKSTSSWGGTRKLPHAFTESGIYMLMTVLKGPLAVEQSRKLIIVFKGMKDYIEYNNNLMPVNEVLQLSVQVNQNSRDIVEIKNKLSIVMDNFIDPSNYKEFLIINEHKFEADIAYQNIFKSAKKSIIIVDDYISLKTLDLLRICKKDIYVHIYSDDVNKQITKALLNDFINETKINIFLSNSNNIFHDRYIFIDEKVVYISGPSLKDAGVKIGTIIKSSDFDLYKPILIKLKNI